MSWRRRTVAALVVAFAAAGCGGGRDHPATSNEHVGSAGVKAIVWCLAITAASYLWARYLYNRRPVR